MKKVPSYSKITTKTQITVNQTQNININSPKNIAITTSSNTGHLIDKKMFKANKGSRIKPMIVGQIKILDNSSIVEKNQKYSRDKREKSKGENILKKSIIQSVKVEKRQSKKSKIRSGTNGSKSATNLITNKNQSVISKSPNKMNKKQKSHTKLLQTFITKKQQMKHKGPQQIKKLQEKLKILQKKMSALHSNPQAPSPGSINKRKNQSMSSQRSKSSKCKQPSANSSQIHSYNANINTSKSHKIEQRFNKKSKIALLTNAQNSIKNEQKPHPKSMLKKSYSDKNMLSPKSRPPRIPESAGLHKKQIYGYNQPRLHYNIETQQPDSSQLKVQDKIDYKQKDKQSSMPSKNKFTSQGASHEEQIIHKFVTQVGKNPKLVQIHHHQHVFSCNSAIDQQRYQHYYIANLIRSLNNPDYMIYKEHLTQSLNIMTFLQNNIRKPSIKQLESHSYKLPQIHPENKPILVLDLDETLIHCNQTLDLPHDVCLKIKFPTGQKIDAGVNIRPYALQLLKQLSKFCQIIVFTASHECYANVVLDYLDPFNNYISHRLYRHHCWPTEGGIYVKDLRIFKKRNLQNILLVDNAAYSYFYQLQNGIPIIPFYDDKEDDQLLRLIDYVKMLIKVREEEAISLRKANQKYFRLTQYLKFNDIGKLAKTIYNQNQFIEFQKYLQAINKNENS